MASWVNPTAERFVTSHFARLRFHPKEKVWKAHTGTDFRAPFGTTIRAASAGVVTRSLDDAGAAGSYVRVEHGDGIWTGYSHLSRRDVRTGDRVAAGQRVGRAGESGSAEGAHLHFEVSRGGTKVNPVPFLAARVGVSGPGVTSSTASAGTLRDEPQEDDMPTADEIVKALLAAPVMGRPFTERLVQAGNRAGEARVAALAALGQTRLNAVTLVQVGNRALRAQQKSARALAEVRALAAMLQVSSDDLQTRSEEILDQMPDNGMDELPADEPELAPDPPELDEEAPGS